MDFGNPKKLRILTICVLFQVLKRLEEEEGGAYRCRLCDTPSEAKVPFKKIRQIYVCIYIYVCVCVNVCVYVCVCMYMYYIIICIIYFFLILFLCVYIDLALAVFLLYAILFQTFLLLNFTLKGHLSRLTPHGHLQVACTLFLVKLKFHTHWCKFFSA